MVYIHRDNAGKWKKLRMSGLTGRLNESPGYLFSLFMYGKG